MFFTANMEAVARSWIWLRFPWPCRLSLPRFWRAAADFCRDAFSIRSRWRRRLLCWSSACCWSGTPRLTRSFTGLEALSRRGTRFPVAICFMIDPIGAGLAALVALLVLAALSFSWSYFKDVRSLYHALMLVFLAAMCGLCLTGDLFNLFVWFELMTAAAVGLCGYKSEERSSLLGALTFSITNTIAAFLSLAGIGMLYALTGSLNMAEVGRAMAANNASTAFLGTAFLFVCAGFLVKAAVAPFQFWLADAHAVAPTPVCVLFSGVMVELGVYAICRIYWLVFQPALGSHAHGVENLFLVIGSLTAVVGAIYCFGQRHQKRLLAFSTISHIGLMVLALGLGTPAALGALAIYVVGHALIKGALFLTSGIFLHRFNTVDEFELRGRGWQLWPLSAVTLVAALGLAGVPPLATGYAEAIIEQVAQHRGLDWLIAVIAFAEILTAGAVLRMAAHVYLGWGKTREATSRGAPYIPMDSETDSDKNRVPLSMWMPAVVLLALAAVIAIPENSRDAVMQYAARFEDSSYYRAVVLRTAAEPEIEPTNRFDAPPFELKWHRLIGIVGAVLVSLAALFPHFAGRTFAQRLGNRHDPVHASVAAVAKRPDRRLCRVVRLRYCCLRRPAVGPASLITTQPAQRTCR